MLQVVSELGQWLVTQQVGDGNNTELLDFLQGETNSAAHSSWDLSKAVVELEAAAFHVNTL